MSREETEIERGSERPVVYQQYQVVPGTAAVSQQLHRCSQYEGVKNFGEKVQVPRASVRLLGLFQVPYCEVLLQVVIFRVIHSSATAVFRRPMLLTLFEYLQYFTYLYCEYCLYSELCTALTPAPSSSAVSTAHAPGTPVFRPSVLAILRVLAIPNTSNTQSILGSMKFTGGICA